MTLCSASVSRKAVARARLAALRHATLLRNSAAMAFGTGGSAVLGFAYWWLAARTFSPEAMGKASALLSLMALVGLIGEGGLGTMLTGELMRRPHRQAGLIAAAALVALMLSIGAGSIGLVVLGLVPEASTGLISSVASDFWLIVGAGLTGLSFILDQAFVGLLQSGVRMLRQLLFSIAKLGLLAAVAIWATNESAILATWVAALLLSLAAVEMLVRKRGWSLFHRPDFALLNALKRTAIDHYRLDLGIMAPAVVMPYLVTVLLSPASNAPFSVVWMVVSVLSVVPASLTTVLFPVIRADPDHSRAKMLLSLGASMLFAIVCSAVILLYSSQILRFFNPLYPDIAGTSLKFLGFGLIGLVIKFHICTFARLRNVMREASIWFLIGGLFELACTMVGSRIAGLEGLVIGWVAGVLVEGLGLFVAVVRSTATPSAELAAARSNPGSLSGSAGCR